MEKKNGQLFQSLPEKKQRIKNKNFLRNEVFRVKKINFVYVYKGATSFQVVFFYFYI